MFRPSLHARQGFTLVEVMVVIAIVAILISLLVPAVQQSREVARTVICNSNVRSQLVGLSCYSSDNNQFLPPLYITGGAFAASWGYPSWPLVTIEDNVLLGQYTQNVKQKDGVTDTYNQWLPSTRSVWFCPNYGGANTGAAGTTLYGLYGGTANLCPIMNAPSDYSNLLKSSDIRNPAAMIFDGDSGGRQWDPNGYWPNYSFFGTTDVAAEAANTFVAGPNYILNYRARHANLAGANFGFFDGHAQTLVQLQALYQSKAINVSRKD